MYIIPKLVLCFEFQKTAHFSCIQRIYLENLDQASLAIKTKIQRYKTEFFCQNKYC